MKPILSGLAIAGALALSTGAASAQVQYDPYNHPYGYGYPVPGGVLQPDEVQGTGLSFDLLPTPDPYPPAVRVVARCKYPNGWNVTDFSRDLNGTPAGIDHTCPVIPIYRRHRY